MVGCQAASAQSRLKKAVLHLDALSVSLALVDQVTTLSTYGCKDATIMPLLQALAGYCQIINIGTHKGIVFEFGHEIVYANCEKEFGRHGALE